ncbi:MAG: substrate-binding domain-containing protein, partial [Thermoplasmata archaeon]|nr:substrate-binding domain-containing protein [Thermoplasmata archaeon]
SGIGNPNAQTTLNIGGSTTLYHLDQNAISWFEANNTNVKLANNQGGSGSGILALCQGHVDISASSRPITSGDVATCPALSAAVSTVIGYDAVIPIVQVANPHGLVSISSQALNIVYWQNGGQPTAAAGYPSSNALTTAVGGKLTPASWGILNPGSATTALGWKHLPKNACFDPLAGSGGTSGTMAGTPGFLDAATYTVGPCLSSWTYDASANTIQPFARFDNGGTSEAFDNNVMGIKCGTDQQLASCGFVVANNPSAPASGQINGYTGNTAVIGKVATSPDALGYTSWGQALASTAQGGGAGLVSNNIGLMGAAQTGGNGNVVFANLASIKNGIAAGYGNAVPGGYVGWRPLQYNTMGPATGEALRFIQFVTQPGTENTLDGLDFFISTYQ